jgi:glycosyltransferase involved in cell wall biosynthesis
MLYQKDGSLCPSTSRNRCCGRCYRRYDHWADIPLRRRAFSLMTAGVSRFVTPSRRLRDLHVARGYDPGRFAVVPYGISGDVPVGSTDDEERSALRSRLRKLMQDGPETVLHFSGVLVETKGLDTLIAAMPLVSSHLGPTQLWVSGRGEDRYVERLERLGTPPVHLLGKLMFNNVREVYGCAGLSLVPSVWYDNSPVVIYESLMAGTPVLGSDLGGIPELIEEGVTGYVVPPRDAEALAAKVIEHFSKPARVRREMRRACREYAAQHFTLDRHVDAISEIFASVLQ